MALARRPARMRRSVDRAFGGQQATGLPGRLVARGAIRRRCRCLRFRDRRTRESSSGKRCDIPSNGTRSIPCVQGKRWRSRLVRCCASGGGPATRCFPSSLHASWRTLPGMLVRAACVPRALTRCVVSTWMTVRGADLPRWRPPARCRSHVCSPSSSPCETVGRPNRSSPARLR